MTHQNHLTNGASLEDCHTNFFALTDLCGIKWRKLVLGERANASGDPLDDPVLRSYSRCLAVDILCVWRRVAAPKPEPDTTGNLFELSLPVTGSGGSVIHPPLSLTAAKELWIFWYGEEPDLTDLLAPELLKSPDGGQGSWESGITYECRSLLFKALHNLIERCLLSKEIVRLGRWFVQPCSNSECGFGKNSHHLSFSFAFFVHGESTVCASMDLRVHPAVRPLTPEYLADAAAQANTSATNNSANGGNSGTNPTNNADNSDGVKAEGNSNNNEIKPKSVILAPFGLAATLTGQSFRNLDPVTQRSFEDWCAFYPLCNKENENLPPMVEVLSGGVKMRYPSKYVLITDLDDEQYDAKCKNVLPVPILEKSINDLGNPITMHSTPSISNILPERVWQDLIVNSTNLPQTASNATVGATSMTTTTIKEENGNSASENLNNSNSVWDFVDPTQKTTCVCTKCKKLCAGRTTSTSQLKSNSRPDKISHRTNRIPFHKRQHHHTQDLSSAASYLFNPTSTTTAAGGSSGGGSTTALSSSSSSSPSASTPPTTTTAITTNSNNCDSIIAPLSISSQRSICGDSTPQHQGNNGGSLLYLRNPHSIPESLTAIPSVGSPGSAGPSPHPNSALSQPTSVPPPDQLMAVISPIQPTSASNLQPSTPNDGHMDKNTPAATPTDPQDSKSTTASPYLQAAPSSVEPAAPSSQQSQLLEQVKVKIEPNQTTATSSSGGSSSSTSSGSGSNSSMSGNGLNNNSSATNVNSSNNNDSGNSLSGTYGGSANINSNSNSVNSELKNILTLMKRPLLTSRDYENIVDDDYMPQQLLYDYSTWVAWMNHPVKRYKPNEDSSQQQRQNRQRKDLYADQNHHKPSYLLSTSTPAASAASSQIANSTPPLLGIDGQLLENQIKSEPNHSGGSGSGGDDELNASMMQMNDIKKEPIDDVEKNENLYTSEGLQASYKDLDQLFDEENSGSSPLGIQVHTPPGSNISMGGSEDTKRVFSFIPNTGSLRPEELSKMFPTPPSLEHHPNSSPCGAGGLSDQQLDLIDSPNLGSPIDEPIEDWSYVFVPPSICKFVGSSKYAPLTNLPSAAQPIISLPPNMTYKPSWQQHAAAAAAAAAASSSNNSSTGNNANNSTPNNNNNNNNSNNNLNVNADKIQIPPMQQTPSNAGLQLQPHMHQQQLQHQQQQQQQFMTLPQPGRILTPNPHSRPSSVTPMMPGVQPNNMMNFMGGHGGPPVGPPGVMLMNSMQHPGMGLRPDMSPISPAGGNHPYASGMQVSSPLNNQFRRNALPPPPPYEQAVASPATSTSSYLNKQFNSVEAPATPSTNRVPEANALLLNLLLYDTALNVFKDHNFDSCTLCVCNAGHKVVGNIRGSDSGVYLALPGTTLDPSSLFTGSCFASGYGIDSPAGMMGINHNIGYMDEDPIKCSCGFSAVVNRRLAHRSGLFFEDEQEITGMAEDPIKYKRFGFSSGEHIKSENPSAHDRDNCDTLSQVMMDLLQEQCALVQSSSSSIQRAIQCFRSMKTATSLANTVVNMLEYSDAQDIICLALDQSRLVFETQFHNNRMEMTNFKPYKYSISVHKWPFVKANGPRSNKDIIRVMKSMQPLLQDAFHKKCTTRLWDAPYTVQGPLTWRQFHRMASSSSGQCEPQPIPSVVVGHEKDWLSVSPYAIQYWDKLLLEPYSYARDVAYVVIAPDNDHIVGRAKSFFKELSTTYEMCKLGRHNPIKGWDGILRVGKRNLPNNSSPTDGLDEWFASLGDSKSSELLKLYAQTCQQQLVPYLSKIPSDKSLLDPPEGMNSSANSSMNRDRSLPSPMLPPSTPDSSQTIDKAPSTPKSSDIDMESQRDSLNNSATTPTTAEPLGGNVGKDEINPPCIVIYVLNPFSTGYDSQDMQRLACLALLRCYSNILASIPESVRSNINFQIISMESVIELGRSRDRLRSSDEMRCLALSVFSQCRRHLTHSASVKSLTGFGTAANMELFLKNKDEKNRAAYKLYTPPYILSGRHEKSENTETFGTTSIEQQSSIMYCSYCLSEDQRWLLAVATDDRGELLETITINIDIPNRRRRKKASARRMGLQKLMDFIIGVISQSGQPWRIVVGRIGRIGHGELKGWSWLLSKQNLLKASKQLKDICDQCSLMYPHAVPSILSACLVTLEPDSNLRVMPDQFTPDERFSQISMQSPLSTPHDVTCTHILVFPTSAKAQSSQSAFHETHINGFDLDEEELFALGEGDDDMNDVNMNGIDEIFGNWDNDIQTAQANSERSRPNSANGMEDIGSRQSPGNGNCGSGRNNHSQQDTEEVGQLLQQPLALGYLVSTAPTGRMPAWFWSSCPHLENVCPVFLKTALHLHSPAIQQNTDDILHQNQSSATDHPLDSTFTADVLRYVLEGYNVLSWLAMDSNTHDRLSCLPIHVQVLMQLYHMTAAMA